VLYSNVSDVFVNGIKYSNSTVKRENKFRMGARFPQRKIVLGANHEHEHYDDDDTDDADGGGGDVRSRFDGWDWSLLSLGSVFTSTPPSFEFAGERFPFPSISFSFSSRDGDLRFVPPVVIEAVVEGGGVTVRSRRKGELPIFIPVLGSGVPDRERERDRDKGVLPRLVWSRRRAAVCDDRASAWHVA